MIWVIGVSVGFILILAIAAVVLVLAQPQVTAMPAVSTPLTVNRESPALGPAAAPVKIIEYADFGCPTCRAWHQSGALERLRQKYGDRIQFIWRDFPVITAQSPKAAEAGQCANDQGKFWEYHDYLYAHADDLSIGALKAAAGAAGIEPTAFNQCLDTSKYKGKVDQSIQEGLSLRLLGTPTFLINDRQVPGVPTYEYLVRVIDPLLSGQ